MVISRGTWQSGKLDLYPKGSIPQNVPTPVGKISVKDWLSFNGVKPWEVGGKIAFAKKHGLFFGTDEEFIELFKRY